MDYRDSLDFLERLFYRLNLKSPRRERLRKGSKCLSMMDDQEIFS